MPIEMQPLPSAEFLHSRIIHDTVHGHLYWRHRPRTDFLSDRQFNWWNTRYACQRADGEMPNGYMRVRFLIDGVMRTFQAHRIIWKMAHGYDPLPMVDHIDRDPTNNRLFNLRIATASENMCNRTIRSRKPGGAVGAYPNGRGKFRSQVSHGGKLFYLGTFATQEAARAAFLAFPRTA